MSQGVYWLLTIPHANFLPYRPPTVQYIRGQLEQGNNTDYLHWQLLVVFSKKCRLAAVKKIFGDHAHCELSRSSAADTYVWKDETAIPNTRFELGERKLKRNDERDWDKIRQSARSGDLESVPADVYVRCYNQLKRIAVDHLQPVGVEREVVVFWGRTGTGKSRRAWGEAGIIIFVFIIHILGLQAYPKDPRSKFWDGYRGQEHVVIDEFRGGIDIAHLLRWFDRYPVIVEVKGSSVVLSAKKIWITSNISPEAWYPDTDPETIAALRRRINVTHFP